MRGYAKIVGVLAVALVLVSVAMLNADQQVTLTVFPGFALPELPVFVIILLAMLGGVLVAAAVSVPSQLRRTLEVRELRKQIARLEREPRVEVPPDGAPALITPDPPVRARAEPEPAREADGPTDVRDIADEAVAEPVDRADPRSAD